MARKSSSAPVSNNEGHITSHHIMTFLFPLHSPELSNASVIIFAVFFSSPSYKTFLWSSFIKKQSIISDRNYLTYLTLTFLSPAPLFALLRVLPPPLLAALPHQLLRNIT
jgi:hypothetical protein